jgi:ABC-type phosphate/phosphonate transport system substrate-binding protein
MSSTTRTLMMGAVAYDAKVVPIWEGFKEFFADNGLDFDFVLYSNYEKQVEAHFAGHFDVAWNSPLAWLQAEMVAAKLGRSCEAIAMRDTDQDLTSLIIVKEDAGITSLADLRGKTVAVGADDSPQGTLIPLEHLRAAGLEPGKDFEVQRHDLLVGKHGDHIGGEREAAKAMLAGDAAAACMIDGNHAAFIKEGSIPTGATRVLAQTGKYDHCNFTILDDAPKAEIARFTELLLGMSYDDPKLRPLLDMEGLKQWKPGRTSGYALLADALAAFGTVDEFVSGLGARCK